MFEKFQSPAVYIIIQAILAHYASGRVIGVTLDIGDGVAHAMPFYQGEENDWLPLASIHCHYHVEASVSKF